MEFDEAWAASRVLESRAEAVGGQEGASSRPSKDCTRAEALLGIPTLFSLP